MIIQQAKTAQDFEEAKTLFRAYAAGLPIPLDFQGFDAEMARFPEGYDLILLAKDGNRSIGVVALKPHDAGRCEMKRLFVAESALGRGVGRALSLAVMDAAKAAGYSHMVLDSLRRLKPAVALYTSLGFTEIAPYNFNPEGDVVYMERAL